MINHSIIVVALSLLLGLSAQAQEFDFSAMSPSGHTLYYSITDKTMQEVEVVCPVNRLSPNNSNRPWDGYIRPFGKVILPSVVHHQGVDYKVVSIGWNAFYGCYEMNSLTISKNIRDFKTTAFEYCRNLEEIIVDTDNPVFDSRGGCNAIIKTKDNELVYGCSRTVIPNTVTAIAWYAFRGSGLDVITIPQSVKSISDQAFYGCKLTEVTIPATVEYLGYSAFDDKVTLSLSSTTLRLETGLYYFDDIYDEEGYAQGVCVVPCGTKEVYKALGWDKYYLFSDDCEDYTVDIDDAAGCGMRLSASKARFGTKVQIFCNSTDYSFVIMSGTSPTYIEVKGNTFLMPPYDVTVKSVRR